MTKLSLHRMPQGMHGASGQIVARFSQHQRITLDHIAEEIAGNCTLTKADIVGCVVALADIVAKYTTRGCSVALGELGTFSASLKVETTPVPNKPNAVRVTTVEAGRMRFRASPYLRKRMAESVARSIEKPRSITPTPPPATSTEERLALVQKYLRHYHVISVRQYASLANISHYRAATELRLWRKNTAITHIGTAGCGTHKMAVWEEQTSD